MKRQDGETAAGAIGALVLLVVSSALSFAGGCMLLYFAFTLIRAWWRWAALQ